MPHYLPRIFCSALFLWGLAHSSTLLAADAAGGDVPKGEVNKYTFESSKIFPGTIRDYWVYVPKQYDPAKPACVHVNQDGVQYNAPAVFDELIHKKEIPVIIGVFVMHGRVNCIIPTPNGKVSNLTFGGQKFDTIFATCGNRVYSRKVKVQGSNGWQTPQKPAAPRL